MAIKTPPAAPGDRASSMPGGSVRRHLAVGVAVFLIAALVLAFEASWSPFEADEADYTATSRYFGYLFLQRDVAREEWGSNHWTRTQPPLTRYIVGFWLTLYGYDLEKMNQPYVSTASSFEVNRQKGRVPTDDVLARARQPMVVLGAGAIALLYALGVVLGGPLVGLGAAGLALSSAFIRYTLVHAWAEAPLAFFLLLAALLAAMGVRRMREGGSVLRWGSLLGIALGLAAATKLTGLVGVALTLAGGAALGFWLWQRREDRAGGQRIGAWASLAAVLALAVFVAVNPYLWRGPVAGLWGMIEERREEMAFQQKQWPEYAVHGRLERPWLTLVGSLQVGPLAETPLAAPLNVPLLLVGIIGLVAQIRQAGLTSPAAMLAAWALAYAVVIVLGLGLKYPRYFMPTTLLFLPLVSLGLLAVFNEARRSVAGKSRLRWARSHGGTLRSDTDPA